jgi:hypothetical protein
MSIDTVRPQPAIDALHAQIEMTEGPSLWFVDMFSIRLDAITSVGDDNVTINGGFSGGPKNGKYRLTILQTGLSGSGPVIKPKGASSPCGQWWP